MKKILAFILAIVLCLASVEAFAATVAVKGLKMNTASFCLYTGQSYRMTVSVTPANASNKKVTWSSSNTKVAKVSQTGVVNAVGAGTATITAKSGNGKKATCRVTVKNVAVTGVSFKKSTVETMGKTKLDVTVIPANATNKKLTWTSSNTKIATVDKNGFVTPKNYGTAVITAKSSNGKKASCTVVVKKDVTVKKSYTVENERPFSIIDTMVLVVDGKSGKIVKTDCYQNKTDFTVVIGMTFYKNGINAYNVQDGYADFRSNWGFSVSIGLGKLSIKSGDMITKTNVYRLYKDGTIKVLNSSCTDWLGLCK